MDTRIVLTVFATIFPTEPGGKSRLATLLFATERVVDRLTIFVGAALSHLIDVRILQQRAGGAFILVGIWTLLQAGA